MLKIYAFPDMLNLFKLKLNTRRFSWAHLIVTEPSHWVQEIAEICIGSQIVVISVEANANTAGIC